MRHVCASLGHLILESNVCVLHTQLSGTSPSKGLLERHLGGHFSPHRRCGIAIETKNIGVGGRRGFDCGSRRTANLGGDRLIRTPIIILEG